MSDFWRPQEAMWVTQSLAPGFDSCAGEPVRFHCEILNSKEVFDAGYCAGRPRTKPYPVTKLKITRDDFSADFFKFGNFGAAFVSERLREVMDLRPSGVRFFDVDASQSAPLPRSKNYQVMEVAAVEDVSDRETSKYDMSGGSPWRSHPDHRFVFRQDATPKHELFYDAFFPGLYCTEIFALRVLTAGCTGVRFSEPNNPRLGRYFYRTLRGIEEYVEWDAINKVEVTELIERIH
jgi:hypothetical protein